MPILEYAIAFSRWGAILAGCAVLMKRQAAVMDRENRTKSSSLILAGTAMIGVVSSNAGSGVWSSKSAYARSGTSRQSDSTPVAHAVVAERLLRPISSHSACGEYRSGADAPVAGRR